MACQGLECVFDTTFVSAISSTITAFATIALVYVTFVLAKETKILSKATSQAHITATIEPNAWTVTHVDLFVTNTGNAVAYDIQLEFDPPLPYSKGHRRDLSAPLHRISILKPGQTLQSNLSEFSEVDNKDFLVTISWTKHPKYRKRENLSYVISMRDYDGVSYLGPRNPTVMIAEQIKKIRDDWKKVTSGNSKLKIDTFSQNDRDEEKRKRLEWIDQARRERSEKNNTGES